MDCEFKEIAERNGLQPAPNTPIVDEASFHAAILHSYIVTADGAIVTRTNPSSHTFISQPVSLEPFPSFDPDVVVTPPSPTTPHAEIGPDVIVTPPSPITSQAGLATDDDDDEAESYLEMAPKKTTNGKAAKKPKGKEKDDEVWAYA
ncbi:hypothetical protein G7Y89_g3326 [Cudoniella acicularis]|uniref:Uncharacterized protein n=1 Tax=Cudoniella acicularis TaxID=354080 RepID=A0A8H4RTK9_9HELO|nr:hypothetical protein G7Y89_g3326 [Cudoniella acicularis]